MAGQGAVAERPRTVDDVVYAPVSVPRRAQSFVRSRLSDLHHPRPRRLELVALELLLAVEALILLVLFAGVH